MKKIIKDTYKVFSEDNIPYLGFIANLGLVTLSYILLWAIKELFNLNNASQIINLHIFFASYLLLLFYNYKYTIGKNAKFNAGFVLSAMIVITATVILYLINLF